MSAARAISDDKWHRLMADWPEVPVDSSCRAGSHRRAGMTAGSRQRAAYGQRLTAIGTWERAWARMRRIRIIRPRRLFGVSA